jgi:malate synthase
MREDSSAELVGPGEGRATEVLTNAAMGFLADLEREFGPRRAELLKARAVRTAEIEAGALPRFPTNAVRTGDWKVGRSPKDLEDRRVEITGPTDRKMIINALNSGAKVFMADFEDSNTPTWKNVIDGQINLKDAVDRSIRFEAGDRVYELNDEVATLVVRPRGWHLDEERIHVDGRPVSGSLFDYGLYVFHNHDGLAKLGSGPYFYLPKLEGRLEARLWDDVFTWTEEKLNLAHGTIKATVLIEHVLAAFEMEEILYELRDHSVGLNAGRWDYIFSVIKTLGHRKEYLLPDREQVTMTVPFMRAYTDLLVATCHRRGTHAIGGMSAFIPNRHDPEATEKALSAVKSDKLREARAGCDGTWVAHPDLVPVAMACFDSVLGDRPNQLDRQWGEVGNLDGLLDINVPGGRITMTGLRTNVKVGILYIESWLRGVGAAALFNQMEDAATAEICRSQVWQWVHHSVRLEDGSIVTDDLVRRVVDDELAAIREIVGDNSFTAGRFEDARRIFEEVALSHDLPPFLTVAAQSYLSELP